MICPDLSCIGTPGGDVLKVATCGGTLPDGIGVIVMRAPGGPTVGGGGILRLPGLIVGGGGMLLVPCGGEFIVVSCAETANVEAKHNASAAGILTHFIFSLLFPAFSAHAMASVNV